ncbi:MAG: type II toxin-antitoxin system VapC family toxin [Candidatus Competibacterales bacterium]
MKNLDMTESVYIESSVISYFTARQSRDVVITARQAITESWWEDHKCKYEAFISGLVIQEISRGDEGSAQKRLKAVEGIPLLGTSEEALELAEDLLAQGAVPSNSEEDALHIGIAAAAGVNFLLTWNFKHINNAHTKVLITSVIEAHGFVCPILCSPEELGAEI